MCATRSLCTSRATPGWFLGCFERQGSPGGVQMQFEMSTNEVKSLTWRGPSTPLVCLWGFGSQRPASCPAACLAVIVTALGHFFLQVCRVTGADLCSAPNSITSLTPLLKVSSIHQSHQTPQQRRHSHLADQTVLPGAAQRRRKQSSQGSSPGSGSSPLLGQVVPPK